MVEKQQVLDSTPIAEEPLYGTAHLLRKYKVTVAIPPSNDVDVYVHDCGFIAIINASVLQGFNVSVGSGLGFAWNNTKKHSRLADIIGYCVPDDEKYLCEAIMLVTRDFSDRTNWKHSRVKYCMEGCGVAFYREQVVKHLGKPLGILQGDLNRFELQGWVKTGIISASDSETLKGPPEPQADQEGPCQGHRGNCRSGQPLQEHRRPQAVWDAEGRDGGPRGGHAPCGRELRSRDKVPQILTADQRATKKNATVALNFPHNSGKEGTFDGRGSMQQPVPKQSM